MIIDDDLQDQFLIQKAIARAGFEVVIDTAQNGDEGLKRASAFKPDLVVLDSAMTGRDGFDVCAQIKSITSRSKVVICTGVIDAWISGKAESAGADECCLKTMDLEDLMIIIRCLIEG